jgi:hypothetical protein
MKSTINIRMNSQFVHSQLVIRYLQVEKIKFNINEEIGILKTIKRKENNKQSEGEGIKLKLTINMP